ncbi:protein toll-like [Anticarsia gemmatalis]|uniref:protein toll-like n=1 Tax=Anticarsia gemmatalis TaxID=129554 RepID=UPI003F76B7E5
MEWGDAIEELNLNDNVQLGDVCPEGIATNEYLLTRMISTLTTLSLRNTGAKTICHDWREMHLSNLNRIDLSDNLITNLTFLDLNFTGNQFIYVNLMGNNVTQLAFDREGYKHFLSNREEYCESEGQPRSIVTLSSKLHCDCNTQWAAYALQECSPNSHLIDAHCDSGTPLSNVPLDDLVCAASPEECVVPPPCRCDWLERIEDPARVLRVSCEHAEFTSVPVLNTTTNVVWDLRLAHNNISEVHLANLPPNLLGLDLRYNYVPRLGVDTLKFLLKDERRVHLSGNPFICDCTTEPALRLMLSYKSKIVDFHNVTCQDGSPLFPPNDCESKENIAPLLGGLTALLMTVVLLGACLARPVWRAQVMVILRGLGWVSRLAEHSEDRPYDAFISFSHHDVLIAEEIVQRLESGERPYRMCLHSRDWVPGGWIPELIAASVQNSRRTIAVLSENFLQSTWARAEFREAHAEAIRSLEPRLVVVLLADPKSLEMDDELRRYLAVNTYLRWGDPWFWQKLRAALPAPRTTTSAVPASLALQSLPPVSAPLLAQQAHALEAIDN